MACRLFGAKPLFVPMLAYCQLDSWERISVKFGSEFCHFHSRKCICNCPLQIWRPFCQGGDELVLTKKAALPLAKILATCRNNVSNTGPSDVESVSMPWCLHRTRQKYKKYAKEIVTKCHLMSLQWRHNECNGVSNHRRLDYSVNHFVQAQINQNIKAPRHWPLWREFPVYRWTPRTKDQ